MLKDRRMQARMSVDEVADYMQRSSRTIHRWEIGASNISRKDLQDLFSLYQVPPEEQSEIMQLARAGRQAMWWSPFSDVINPTFKRFLGLEAAANGFYDYTGTLMPGILQTEAYMRAVFRAYKLPDDLIDELVNVRILRQQQMSAREDLIRHFILDESVLRRVVGNRAIMAEQLRRLPEAAQHRNTTVQVVPFETGAHTSILSGFSVLTFSDTPTVAVVELRAGNLYEVGPDARKYTEDFDALRQGALPEPMSLEMIGRVVRERFSQ